ncbi:MAG: HNH endonuclease [Gemmatimonadaceae bacterium]|nr:HNH endonuclease [Gemmatimonadaceae bacterium]NUR19540.1 HNH endonuclease [Gemmatimonadaceae bacterium]
MHGAVVATRFWQKVEKTETCWLWTGARYSATRYGQVILPGRVVRGAHRVAWELTHGPIPDGLFVCHRCDNKQCVRPDHLFLGTPKDNTHDMIAKGLHPTMGHQSCLHGHPFDQENTYVARHRDGRTFRKCRACARASMARTRAARRSEHPLTQH